jgi:ABC-type multidrug transport system fused ATPase/permease subunit
MDLKLLYTERKDNYSVQLEKATTQINTVSNLRLLVAGIFIAAFYFALSAYYLFYALPVIFFIFIVLMRKHSELFMQKTHLENLVKINSNDRQSLVGNFSCYNDCVQFIDPHHPYTHDLDIFGKGSLFQYLNRSTTLQGAAQLANTLAYPLTTQEDILKRQASINELASKIDFRQNFLATGMELEEFKQDKQQLLDWVKETPFLYGKPLYKIVLKVLPLVTAVLIVLSFFVDGVSSFAIAAAALQWTFLSTQLKRVNAFHQYVSRKKNIIDKYARLLHLFGKESFYSILLKDLAGQATHADRKVNELGTLLSAFDARLNFLTNIVVNSILMYDLQCVYRLEKWKEENAKDLNTWHNVINETDVLCSFGTFAFNHADFKFPQINDEKKVIALALGHPLIDARERIANDVSIGNNQSVLIITGANMAGKSTFLRTLGITMVLALNGAPVCAKEFSCPIIGMRSGMRTADSLQDHKSYFYAELDRLKTIMDELRSGKPLLILLDEILKGTNSTDKQAGSIALVKQLIAQNCLALIATHDLALGDLETEYPDKVKNYCFEPTIENDQLSFDYKLKPGLAQKMNATFLMKKMGIIPH